MASGKVKCPGCDCKVSVAEIEKNDGTCPECGQQIFGFQSKLFDDYGDSEDEYDDDENSEFDDDEDTEPEDEDEFEDEDDFDDDDDDEDDEDEDDEE